MLDLLLAVCGSSKGFGMVVVHMRLLTTEVFKQKQKAPTMREALQTRPVNVDRIQVAIGLELVRQGNLLRRVAGIVAGEHDAARLWGEFG